MFRILDADGEGTFLLPLDDLHLALDRLTPADIPSSDLGSEADRTVRDLLEVHVRVPARVIADVLDRVPPPHV
jgi:hypothetical protein